MVQIKKTVRAMIEKSNTKKRIMYYATLLISLLFVITACDKDRYCPSGSHDDIILINNSSKIINWATFRYGPVYKINGSSSGQDLLIQPNSSDIYGSRPGDCWEETFKNGYTAYLLIFDNDTIQAIGWQAIDGTNRGLLKSVEVNIDYLNSNNFTITYP